MVDSRKKDDKPAATTAGTAAGAATRPRMGVRLAPVNDSDQPVVANYATVNVSPGMVFIDFGFLEPAMLAALPRVAKEGGKLPEMVNGRLAVRVDMGYDGLEGLHQQLGRVIAEIRKAAESRNKAEPARKSG